jgi:hypothetical protein
LFGDSRESELSRLYSSPWNRAKKNKQTASKCCCGFFAVQLFQAIAIALASDFLPSATPRANEMEAAHPLV